MVLTGLTGKITPDALGATTLDAFVDTAARRFPGASVIVKAYMTPRINPGIVEGKSDDDIDKLAATLQRFDVPTYLTLGFYVNSPVFDFDAGRFRESYRYVAKRLRAAGVSATKFVWYVHSGQPRDDRFAALNFYPGDEYVDAVGINVTRFTDEQYANHPYFDRSAIPDLLAFAEQKELPVLVVDTQADGVVLGGGLDGAQLVDEFYDPLFELARDPRVAVYAHHHRWLTDSTVVAAWRDHLNATTRN